MRLGYQRAVKFASASLLSEPSPWNNKEAMAYLRVTKATLLRLVRDGKIPATKVGKDWRFLGSELADGLISANTLGMGGSQTLLLTARLSHPQ